MITEAGEFHPSLDFFADGDDLLFPSYHQDTTLLPDADTDDDDVLLLGTSTHSAPGGYFFPSIPENKELSLQPLSLLPHSYHHHPVATDGFHPTSSGIKPNNIITPNLSSSPSSALDFTTTTTTIITTTGGGREVVMNDGPSGGAPTLSPSSAATTPTASGSNSPMVTTTNNNNNTNNGDLFMGSGEAFFNTHHSQQQSHMFMVRNQGVPRVSSMPNMRLNTHQYNTTTTTTMEQGRMEIPAPRSNTTTTGLSGSSKSGSAVDLRRQAAANRAMPRSQSAIELSKSGGMGSPRGGGGGRKHFVPHQQFLTPHHLRKGKGGRQPAADPRLDPKIDPKKAKRILANRLSAARSKLKQKSQIEAALQRVEGLKVHKEQLLQEVDEMGVVCAMEEQKTGRLMQELSQLEESLRVCTTTTTTTTTNNNNSKYNITNNINLFTPADFISGGTNGVV